MDLDDYKYIWKTEKQDWVLVHTEFGYGIVNKRNHSAMIVSDDELEKAIIDRMLAAGNKVYNNMNDAYDDVNPNL